MNFDKKSDRIYYLTVATIPSTTAHAKYVEKISQFLFKLGYNISVYKVGWEKININCSDVKFIGLSPRLPNSSARAITQAICFYISALFSKPQLVITHNAVCAAACRLAGVNFVYDVHGSLGRGRCLRFALAKGHCRAMAFNSKGSELEYRQADLSIPNKTAVIGNGSNEFVSDDERRKNFRRAHRIDDECHVIAYIGSLGPNRGLDTVRDALLKIDMQKRKFIIVGGSPNDLDREQAEFAAAGLNDVVIFLGFLPHEDLIDVLNGADSLLVSYSRSIAAVDVMNPMKVHEYMSTDLPIIYPFLDRVTDIIDGDTCSFGYEPDNPTSLARAFISASAFEDNTRCGKQRANRRITWERIAKDFRELINSIDKLG